MKEELKKEYKLAMSEVISIEKEMASRSFVNLSQYSQQLVKDDYEKAVSKQFDVIEKITDCVMAGTMTDKEAEDIIKSKVK